ncbi:MAG: hypothetical protein WCI96_06720 [Planctomycetota bacterium]
MAFTDSIGVDPAALALRARNSWRIALVCYLVPVSIATHWPRLGFGGGGVFDKFVHFLAFGTLAWIWMHAKPFGRASIGFALAAAWVYFDERTQAIEILGRTFSIYDMVAGWLGVLMAGALLVAQREATAPGTQERADAELAQWMVYSRGSSWMIAAALTIAWVLMLGSAMVLWDYISLGEVFLGTFVYAVGFSGFVGAAFATYLIERMARPRVLPIVSPRARAARLLGAAVIALMLMAAFNALVYLIFPTNMIEGASEDLASEREGFRVLSRGFAFATVLVALTAQAAISQRRASARASTHDVR